MASMSPIGTVVVSHNPIYLDGLKLLTPPSKISLDSRRIQPLSSADLPLRGNNQAVEAIRDKVSEASGDDEEDAVTQALSDQYVDLLRKPKADGTKYLLVEESDSESDKGKKVGSGGNSQGQPPAPKSPSLAVSRKEAEAQIKAAQNSRRKRVNTILTVAAVAVGLAVVVVLVGLLLHYTCGLQPAAASIKHFFTNLTVGQGLLYFACPVLIATGGAAAIVVGYRAHKARQANLQKQLLEE